MVTDSVSEPSVSVSAVLKLRAMARSSVPTAWPAVNVAASAMPTTLTGMSRVVVLRSPLALSRVVALKVRVKSRSLLAGGMMARSATWSRVRVQVPSPLSMPAERVAPAGTLARERVSDSEPSESMSPASICKAMRLSSFPVAEALSPRCNRSATGETVTGRAKLRWALLAFSPSVAMAVTLRVKSASLLAGGVMVSPANWAGVRVHVPSPLLVPAESLAPSGTLPTITPRVSEPSVSLRLLVMFRRMALSSSPREELTLKIGVSATALTVTGSEVVVTDRVPVDVSVLMAETVREKSSPELGVSLIPRPLS